MFKKDFDDKDLFDSVEEYDLPKLDIYKDYQEDLEQNKKEKKKRTGGLFVLLVLACSLVLCVYTFMDIGKNADPNHLKENLSKVSVVSKKSENEKNDRFSMELVGSTNSNEYTFNYYRDNITDVMYLIMLKNGASGSNITIMLEPDTGKPLTFHKYVELYNKSKNKNLENKK